MRALLVAVVLAGCRPAESPDAHDALSALAVAVERAERAAPVALAACGLVAEDHRASCEEGARALAEVAAQGRGVLDTAAACQEAQDEACLASALERAAEIVRVLR